MPNDESTATKAWSRLKRDTGAVLWASFLSASLATMLFFAYFDPLLLAHDDDPPAWLADRMTGYALGFFFFWSISAITGLLVAYLARDDKPEQGAEKKS